ncbi:SDR family oxidoreductase [Escherichia coli]
MAVQFSTKPPRGAGSDELNNASRWQGIRAPGGYQRRKPGRCDVYSNQSHDEPLAALVNNAGILFTQCTVENLTAERINPVFHQRDGISLCRREAVKRMALKNGGSGGATSMCFGGLGSGSPREYVDYAASKGAIDSQPPDYRWNSPRRGSALNCVRPGFYLYRNARSGGEPGRVDRVKSNIPMQRGGQAEEVAQAIVWLLSDKASYVTGSFIDLAGGNKTGKL